MKSNPTCLQCGTTESTLWTNAESLGAICLDCVNHERAELKSDDEDASGVSPSGGGSTQDETNTGGRGQSSKRNKYGSTTRTTRSYKTRLNPLALPKCVKTAKGRRGLFKRKPYKSPDEVATTTTSEYVFHKGSYMQVGDIVSMIDEENDVYYAQLNGFLTDQYCEKSAVVTWLLPTKESPPPSKGFDPSTYIIGPEEEVPRKLECMEFVMHAPSDYYKSKTTPYPMVHAPRPSGYIWATFDRIRKYNAT